MILWNTNKEGKHTQITTHMFFLISNRFYSEYFCPCFQQRRNGIDRCSAMLSIEWNYVRLICEG